MHKRAPPLQHPMDRFAIHPQLVPNPQLHAQSAIVKRRMRLNPMPQLFDPWRIGTTPPSRGGGRPMEPSPTHVEHLARLHDVKGEAHPTDVH